MNQEKLIEQLTQVKTANASALAVIIDENFTIEEQNSFARSLDIIIRKIPKTNTKRKIAKSKLQGM